MKYRLVFPPVANYEHHIYKYNNGWNRDGYFVVQYDDYMTKAKCIEVLKESTITLKHLDNIIFIDEMEIPYSLFEVFDAEQVVYHFSEHISARDIAKNT